MKVEVETVEGVTIVRPLGRLDAVTSPELGKVLTELTAEPGARIVLDFSSSPFVASAGLRVIVATAKKTMAGGRLVLCGITPLVRQVFDLAGLDRIMKILNTSQEALAAAKS
ncbi:MAG TPA: STAS domain-containing protein [Caulifigura sp.]|nr:STAS domain-containing protein [Caulifigura sp.]